MFVKSQLLRGKKILVTAGPTREYLDPVRFITNESSGKMGYALAAALVQQGAEVILVSGPVSISPTIPESSIIQVTTTREMLNACSRYFEQVDAAIFSAAVADYRPRNSAENKIKKSDPVLLMEFVKNPDIAGEFGKVKTDRQWSVGFALETDNMIENAAGKMRTKNFDAIVMNSPGKDEGFGYDTNRISIMRRDGSIRHFGLKSKKEVAEDIVKELEMLMEATTGEAYGNGDEDSRTETY